MSRNWTREELAATLARNPGLRVTAPQAQLERLTHRNETDLEKLARESLILPAGSQTIIPPRASSTNCPKVTPANGIHELMACPSYQGGALLPEESLSVAVATELRRLTHQGKLRAVWSRVPGEHPEGGRYALVQQIKRTCMGHVPGVPDLFFGWATGCGLIELKTEAAQATLLTPSGKAGLRKGRRTYLRGRQRLFAAWAEAHGVRHAVARSVPEVVAVLTQWGVMDG